MKGGGEGGMTLLSQWKYFIGVENDSDYRTIQSMEDYFFSLVMLKKEKENNNWKVPSEITLLGEKNARTL